MLLGSTRNDEAATPAVGVTAPAVTIRSRYDCDPRSLLFKGTRPKPDAPREAASKARLAEIEYKGESGISELLIPKRRKPSDSHSSLDSSIGVVEEGEGAG